jgi:CDP-paratose 2-epimerase
VQFTGKPYTIYGYKGKQVRDQIHCRDVARLFVEFFKSPRCGEVYNLGGGRQNSISILETIRLLRDRGLAINYRYDATNRTGDHICYISDLTKIRSHFPGWKLEYDLNRILDEIIEQQSAIQHRMKLPPPSGASENLMTI